MSGGASTYYIPHSTHWPIVGSIGLMAFFAGFAMTLNDTPYGPVPLVIGALVLIYMMFGWFGQVALESERGTYDHQVDTSFRMGMMWFIFSEVMFFAAFLARSSMPACSPVPGLVALAKAVRI